MAALNQGPDVARHLCSHGTVAGALTADRACHGEQGPTSARSYSLGCINNDDGANADYGASRANLRVFDHAPKEGYGVDSLATATQWRARRPRRMWRVRRGARALNVPYGSVRILRLARRAHLLVRR
jgi:hypothetical protein